MRHGRIGMTGQAEGLGRGALWIQVALVVVAALGVLTHREVHLQIEGLGTLSVTSPPKPQEEPRDRRNPQRPPGPGAPFPTQPHRLPQGAVVTDHPSPCANVAGREIVASPTGGIQTLEAKP